MNRGKTHDASVTCMKDLERLGSAKMSPSYRGTCSQGIDAKLSKCNVLTFLD